MPSGATFISVCRQPAAGKTSLISVKLAACACFMKTHRRTATGEN
jgi:hypothetical protein